MTDQHAQIQAAMDAVIDAMKAHLAAVQAADGKVDDDNVWTAYVALNNASYAYDDLLLDAYGEVTPWDVDRIDPDSLDQAVSAMTELAEATDPHSHVVSVQQRRDYRVPSVSALIKAAEAARKESLNEDEGAEEPVESVGEAELEPLDGLVAVVEAETPLDLGDYDETDGAGPFGVAAVDRLVGRLDEQPYADLDDEG
jgi:hypothetical protein